MREYPRRRNGDEYYPSGVGDPPFASDDMGSERYARDRKGNELYPDREERVFARGFGGFFYYARDAGGDERYPVLRKRRRRRRRSRGAEVETIEKTTEAVEAIETEAEAAASYIRDPTDGSLRRAVAVDGTQVYPRDASGNEYYLKDAACGRPLLMRRATGERYLARSRNGHALVPWNCLQEFVGEEPCVYSRDAGGNTVYVRESAFPPAYRAVVRCVCHLSVVCPRLTGCHARFY